MSFYKKVQHGATDVSVTFKVLDSTDGTPETGYTHATTGVDFWYRKGATGAVTTITAVTQTVTGAHVDGGLVHVQDGVGRLDLPDAAVTSGVDYIEYGGTFTDMIVIGGVIELEGASAGAVRTFTEATFITDTVTSGNVGDNTTTLVDLADFVDANALVNSTAGELWLWQDSNGALEYFRVQSMTATTRHATVEAWPDGGPLSDIVTTGDKLWRVGYVDMNTVAISDTQQTAGDVPALVTTVDTVVDGIQTDLSNGTDGLGAIKTDTAAILVDTAVLGSPSGASMSADIAAVKSDTAGIQTDLSNGTDGLGAIKTDTAAILVDTGATIPATITAVKSDTADILDDTANSIPTSITAVKSDTANILVDTGTTIPNTLGTPVGGDLSTDIAAVDTVVDAILVDTNATIPATITAVKSDTAAILQDTGTDIPASITTIDTVVDAVKAKTDNLTFTVSNQVDANIESINTQEITGDGGSGSEFKGRLS